MQTQSDFVKTALRVPQDLHRAIHESAKEHQRSFNAEILYRLQTSYAVKPKGGAQ